MKTNQDSKTPGKSTRANNATKGQITITPPAAQLNEWKEAARRKNLTTKAWIRETLNAAAFLTNKSEQIEAIKDLRAFEKAIRGGPISFDEFERSERYRTNHPAESAEADRKRPIEDFSDSMLRDSEHEAAKP